MAREVTLERGLPSAEVRRQILQRAGVILDEARELMERLDRHETAYPRTACDHRRLLLGNETQYRRALGGSVRPVPGQAQGWRQPVSDHSLAV